MKFRVTLKDPDGFGDGFSKAVTDSLSGATFFNEQETETIYNERLDTIKGLVEKWVKFDEYITIEFDTEAGTATVVPIKQ